MQKSRVLWSYQPQIWDVPTPGGKGCEQKTQPTGYEANRSQPMIIDIHDRWPSD